MYVPLSKRINAASLSPRELEIIGAKGCGPSGCAFLDKLIPELCFHSACIQHDVDYWQGGTSADKAAADRFFYGAMKAAVSEKPWYRKPLLYAAAFVYYRVVVRAGEGSFHYGERRTMADLRVRLIISHPKNLAN